MITWYGNVLGTHKESIYLYKNVTMKQKSEIPTICISTSMSVKRCPKYIGFTIYRIKKWRWNKKGNNHEVPFWAWISNLISVKRSSKYICFTISYLELDTKEVYVGFQYEMVCEWILEAEEMMRACLDDTNLWHSGGIPSQN